MRSQEVVVSDEESGHSDCAVWFFEAMAGTDMVFIGSIQSFDELFEWAIFFRFGVKVLESDHFMVCYFRVFVSRLVKEVYPGGIGWVAVREEGEFLFGRGGSNSLLHSDDGRQSFSVVSDMVSGDLRRFT